MALHRSSLATALCGVLLSSSCCFAEDFTFLANVGKVYKAVGYYYEYNEDGVPLIGIITSRLSVDRVKFTSCNNNTIEVEFKKLKRSEVQCLKGPDDNKRKDFGPWTITSKSIAPLVKVETDVASTMVEFGDEKLDFSSLPANFKEIFEKAKIGEPVGFAFTDNGQKSFAILSARPPSGS